MGETGDSGHGSGLDGRAKLGGSSPCHERFPGQSREGLLESRSGLKMGDSRSPFVRGARVLEAERRFLMLQILSCAQARRSLFVAPVESGLLCGRSPL